MVDDIMEVSSDHDQGETQEDIDIDIDFTADANDEDDILEDVGPDMQPEPVHVMQDSEVVDADDLMVDDDTASYTMDDVPPRAHDDDTLIDETIPMSFQTDTGHAPHPSTQIEEHSETREVVLDDPVVSEEQMASWSGDMVQEQVDNAISVEPLSATSHESGPAQTTTLSVEVASTSDALAPLASPTADAEEQEASGPQDTADQSIDETNDLLTRQSPSNLDAQDAVPEETSDENDLHDVVVHYDDKLFPLVRSSSEQSSDDYFFEDFTLTHQPLTAVIEKFREVLQNDFENEHSDYELCLTFEDLGLEIFEHYLPQDVNLSQMMTLHKKLQRNDNAELCEPMIINLSIRPRFETRLQELLAGAEAGHGLSHYLSRDGSPFSEQTLHPECPQDEDIVHDDAQELAVDGEEESIGLKESTLSAGDAEDHIDSHEEDNNDEHGELDTAETGPSNAEDTAVTDHKSPNLEPIGEDVALENGSYDEAKEEDAHEEGDEDQEDDKDQQGDEDQEGEAKYEEKDETQEKDVDNLESEEKLGSTEDNHESTLVDDQKTGASTAVVDFAVHGAADTLSEVQPQEALHDEADPVDADVHEDLDTANGDAIDDEVAELHDDSFDAEVGQGGVTEDLEADIDDGSLDAVDYEDEDATGGDHEALPAEHESIAADESEAPAVNSQPSISAVDSHGDDAPPVDDLDEIDYDEDDDDVTIAGDASQTTTPPTNGSIKRSRVDEDDLGDEDDAPNKDAKRPRS